LDDRREEEYRADMMESNLRYDNAFDTVLSHTPAMEIAEFWHLFGEEDGGGMVEVDADIDLGEGTRLSEAAPAMPFDVSNPMHNPMHSGFFRSRTLTQDLPPDLSVTTDWMCNPMAAVDQEREGGGNQQEVVL
jgi:hypothetical protein